MEKIHLYNHLSDDGAYKTTLLFDSTRALARFKALITQSTSRNSEAVGLEASMGGNPLKLFFGVILTIHEQMNEESHDFVMKVIRRAREIVRTVSATTYPELYLCCFRLYTAVITLAEPSIFTC